MTWSLPSLHIKMASRRTWIIWVCPQQTRTPIWQHGCCANNITAYVEWDHVQKYIAMWGHGILETWVDMRRYHYDATVYTGLFCPVPLFATNNGKQPTGQAEVQLRIMFGIFAALDKDRCH